MQSHFETTPRTTGLHGCTLPYLPGISPEPTLAPRAITVPEGYKRVLDRKAKRQIEVLLAMLADRPVTSLELVTPTSNRDNTASALAQLGGKKLVTAIRDTTAPGAPSMFRLTPAGKREQAAQRAGA